MTSVSLTEKEKISRIFSKEIYAICDVLFKDSGINYFSYARYYKDGTSFTFSSNLKWHEYVQNNPQFFKEILSTFFTNDGFFLWSMHEKKIVERARDFLIDFPLTFVKKFSDCYDVFTFGTSIGNEKIQEFYLNNLEFLKKFMRYFIDKAWNFIKIADIPENRVVIPEVEIVNLTENSLLPEHQKIPNLHDLNVGRLFFYDGEDFRYFSKRETACLLQIITGNSAKKTAESLGISAKTVETHICSMKSKLKCNSRTQLIQRAIELDILDLLKRSKKCD